MAKKPKAGKDRERLRALVEEATVDCYDEHEQLLGLANMIEENVACPFRARVIGEEVTVPGFDFTGQSVFALCERKTKTYRVEVSSLELPEPLPEGFEWIEAYLAWREWNS